MPIQIQNLALVKIFIRCCTTILLKMVTLKKMSTNEYRSRKGLLIWPNPVIKNVMQAQHKKEAERTAKNQFLLWLNNPQL